MFRYLFAALLGLLQVTSVQSKALPRASSAITTPFQFPNNTWIENAAMRANGDLLTTLVTTPQLYRIPQADGHTSAELAVTFPNATSLLGITEVCFDEFVVIAGNYSFTEGVIPRTYSVWSVSFHGNKVDSRKITDIPELGLPNGMTTLDAATGLVLIADSIGGNIWSLNVHTGKHQVAMDKPSMKIKKSSPYPFGINGIKTHVVDGTTYVYYDNMSKSLLVRVPVDPKTGKAIGEYEVTDLPKTTNPDDFTISKDGIVYWASQPTNQVFRLGKNGVSKSIVGGPKKKIVEGPTATVLSRVPGEENVLYIVTNGGMMVPINGFYQGGQVVRVQLDEL